MPVIIKTALDSIVLMTSQSLQIMIRCKYDATSGWEGGGTRGRGGRVLVVHVREPVF